VTRLCNTRYGGLPGNSPGPARVSHIPTAPASATEQPETTPAVRVPADNPAGTVPAARRGTVPAAKSDRAAGWLRGAMLALAVLASAAAVVSWDAQYVLVRFVKHNPAVASLEAGIPDVGALIFAALGIALALHGKRAVKARALNLACVGISLAMNALASTPGWRDLAIWVMPSAVYALASDTLIGVVRAWMIARARQTGLPLTDNEHTPGAIAGAVLLWLVRLALAPPSTVAGFRRWVISQAPAAPTPKPPPRPASQQPPRAVSARPSKPGKQARMITLAAQRRDLAGIPLGSVSKLATALAAEVDLAPGTARRVLLAHVRELQNITKETS
jgi:hypothetical protein